MAGHRRPALVVDAAVADHLEVLRGVPVRSVGVVEAVAQAGALDRLLRRRRRRSRDLEPGGLEDGRQHVDDVVPLVADLAARRDPVAPAHDHPVAGAAEVRDLLGPRVRRVHRQRPAGRVDGVRRGVAQRVEPGRHVGGLVLDAVADEVLAERAARAALAGGAVVAEQVEDQRVVEDAHVLQGVDEPADLHVGVLGEPGVGLHEPGRDPLLGLVELVPVRHALGPRRQLGRLGHDAELLLAGQGLLPLRVPAGVEPAGVLVPPLRRDVERRVRGAEREVGEERPVGGDRLLVLDPGDRVVDQVLGEVVAVLREPVGLDGVAALVELRVPVVHLGAHEAVEEVEALTHRPPRERARGAHLHRRGLVPLADRRRAVAVAAEDLRDGRGAGGPVAVVARLRRRHLARDAHARPSGGCGRSSAPGGSASTAA